MGCAGLQPKIANLHLLLFSPVNVIQKLLCSYIITVHVYLVLQFQMKLKGRGKIQSLGMFYHTFCTRGGNMELLFPAAVKHLP